MNIAPSDISASSANTSGGCGCSTVQRSATGNRGLLRTLVACILLAGSAASGFGMAAGMGDRDQRDRDQREQRERPQQQQPMAPQQAPQQAPREMPQQRGDGRAYDVRADDRGRQQFQQQPQQDTGGRRGGRLTPDERRELRRQINEAGMDLYPATPRR